MRPVRFIAFALSLLMLLPLHRSLVAQAVPSPSSDEPSLVIRRQTHLVVLDVVVVDKKLNPISGLKPSDFIVLEKSQPQTIRNFDEHAPAPQPLSRPAMPKLPPNTFTNYTPVPDGNGPVNILLLDALNTPMKDQAYVRYQMLQYLKNMPAGTRVAVFGLTTHLRILQGFTSDPETLRTVLSGKKGLPSSSVLLNDPVNGDYPGNDMAAFGNAPDFDAVSSSVTQFQAETQSYQKQLRARMTLDAMNDLARYLVGIPGRKNLIWFSGSFPLNIMPDGDIDNPFAVMASMEDEFRQTTDMMTQSQVAVYPVDARGLMTPPMFSAANSGSQYVRNPNAMLNDLGKWDQQTAEEHMTMDDMADATGGKAFYNTNGLKEAVTKSISLGSHYYTITYRPTNDKWIGDFRKIKVKLANGEDGYQLYYRHGYYADDPDHPRDSHMADAPPPSAMRTALLRGAPDPTQIIFEAHIAKVSPEPTPTAAIGNEPDTKLHGPYITYAVNYGVDARNISFQATPDGIYHGRIEFIVLLYDADGNLLNSISNTMEANLASGTYSNVLKHGLQMSQLISVPQDPKHKGEYYLRMGVHDIPGDRVGAVEVPVSAVHAEPAPAKQ
jgi:VWFA-related protein